MNYIAFLGKQSSMFLKMKYVSLLSIYIYIYIPLGLQ